VVGLRVDQAEALGIVVGGGQDGIECWRRQAGRGRSRDGGGDDDDDVLGFCLGVEWAQTIEGKLRSYSAIRRAGVGLEQRRMACRGGCRGLCSRAGLAGCIMALSSARSPGATRLVQASFWPSLYS